MKSSIELPICNHEMHPIRLLTRVLSIFTIYAQNCCVEAPHILSNGAGEEARREKDYSGYSDFNRGKY